MPNFLNTFDIIFRPNKSHPQEILYFDKKQPPAIYDNISKILYIIIVKRILLTIKD